MEESERREQSLLFNSKNINIKKEIIKLLIVIFLIQKSKKVKWKNIHTNFNLEGNFYSDVYYENLINRKINIFLIVQRKVKKYEKFLKNYEAFLFDIKYNILYEKDFSDNILEMKKQVKEII